MRKVSLIAVKWLFYLIGSTGMVYYLAEEGKFDCAKEWFSKSNR